jgi:hypothetical protein
MLWAAVLLGLGLRSYHYLRTPPVWHDEAALIVNVLGKDYAALLGPLRFHEAAPPLFLWLEKAVADSLGDEPLALRLPPFLASCAALLLMVPVSRRLLPAPAVPWALLLFACSEQLSWHACEAKPYAFDVFAATLLAALCLHADRLGLVRLLLVLAVLAPVLLWLSYAACFVYGGVLAALLPAVWRDRRPRALAAWGLLSASVGVAFLALVLGPAGAQRDPVILGEWTHCFPDWDRPWTFPLWLTTSTLEVGRYAAKPLGQGLMLLAFLGGVFLWRSGRRDAVALLGLPVGLALLASCLHRYPYGGVRVMVFAAPAVLLLAAVAVPPSLAWLRERHRLAAAALVLFLLMPVAVAVQRVVWLWPVADPASAAAFVEARRRPDDPVAGNDWTHLYYFRRLGGAFHGPDGAPVRPDGRLWVVWSDLTPPEERLRAAASMVPPDWRVVERFESAYTTTALFARGE